MKKHQNSTVFSEYFEPLINDAKNKYEYELGFISWHFFSSIQNISKVYYNNLYGSGAVSGTMDLIESYTNKINKYNGATKILISEHGYSTENNVESNQFNLTYMQWIGVNQYITNTICFLERPESQLKIDAFYLYGGYAIEHDAPLVLIDSNNKLTLTGQMYYVNKILTENNGI